MVVTRYAVRGLNSHTGMVFLCDELPVFDVCEECFGDGERTVNIRRGLFGEIQTTATEQCHYCLTHPGQDGVPLDMVEETCYEGFSEVFCELEPGEYVQLKAVW